MVVWSTRCQSLVGVRMAGSDPAGCFSIGGSPMTVVSSACIVRSFRVGLAPCVPVRHGFFVGGLCSIMSERCGYEQSVSFPNRFVELTAHGHVNAGEAEVSSRF